MTIIFIFANYFLHLFLEIHLLVSLVVSDVLSAFQIPELYSSTRLLSLRSSRGRRLYWTTLHPSPIRIEFQRYCKYSEPSSYLHKRRIQSSTQD